MATIIAKVAGLIGKNVLSAHLWRREPTPEPTLWQKAAGFSQKAPGFAQKAAGYEQNPPPFFDFPRFSWWIAGKVLPLQNH
jgi:hypothetical protein